MYEAIAVKLIVGMFGVLFFLRIAGKAQMSQITPIDTVNSFVVGALVGGVIYNPQMDIRHLLFAIGIWTMVNLLIRFLLRFKLMRMIFMGNTVHIVRNGKLQLKVFRRNGLDMTQFRALLREKGIFSMSDVDNVRFETNGQLTASVLNNTSESFLFVNDGSVELSSLLQANKDHKWLIEELHRQGFDNISELFCVEWTPGKGFYIMTMDGKLYNGYNKVNETNNK